MWHAYTRCGLLPRGVHSDSCGPYWLAMLLASQLQVTFRRNVKVSRLQRLPAQVQLEARSRCCNFCEQRKISQTAVVLLSTLLLAAPAFGASSSEYISVQDRVRQRSPLQQRKSAGLTDSVETAPDPQAKTLSIPQQAGQIYNFAVSDPFMTCPAQMPTTHAVTGS